MIHRPCSPHRHLPTRPTAAALAAVAALLTGCAGSRPAAEPGTTALTPPGPVTDQTRWTTIGHSVERRPIEAMTLGHGPTRLYLIGLIHGDEPEGLAILPDVLERLVRPEYASLVTTRVVRDMNPDGSTAGTRGNVRGIDLNRNWPAHNFSPSRGRGPKPLSEPETLAVYADLLTFQPDVVVVFHSTRRNGPFVNYDGPADPLADIFAAAAARLDGRWRTQADMGYATPGSLGTYIGIDRKIPILTIEFARGQDGDEAALVGLLAAVRAADTAVAK